MAPQLLATVTLVAEALPPCTTEVDTDEGLAAAEDAVQGPVTVRLMLKVVEVRPLEDTLTVPVYEPALMPVVFIVAVIVPLPLVVTLNQEPPVVEVTEAV